MASPDTIILLIVDYHAAIGGGGWQDPRAPSILAHAPGAGVLTARCFFPLQRHVDLKFIELFHHIDALLVVVCHARAGFLAGGIHLFLVAAVVLLCDISMPLIANKELYMLSIEFACL